MELGACLTIIGIQSWLDMKSNTTFFKCKQILFTSNADVNIFRILVKFPRQIITNQRHKIKSFTGVLLNKKAKNLPGIPKMKYDIEMRELFIRPL